MTLYHVASRRNVASIDRDGLLPELAVNKEKAVWLVSRSNVTWALAHTAAKPGRGAIGDLVVYECWVGRKSVRRYHRGIWRSFDVVRPVSMVGSAAYTDSYPS